MVGNGAHSASDLPSSIGSRGISIALAANDENDEQKVVIFAQLCGFGF